MSPCGANIATETGPAGNTVTLLFPVSTGLGRWSKCESEMGLFSAGKELLDAEEKGEGTEKEEYVGLIGEGIFLFVEFC
jgi:hypothetical protein